MTPLGKMVKVRKPPDEGGDANSLVWFSAVGVEPFKRPFMKPLYLVENCLLGQKTITFPLHNLSKSLEKICLSLYSASKPVQ